MPVAVQRVWLSTCSLPPVAQHNYGDRGSARLAVYLLRSSLKETAVVNTCITMILRSYYILDIREQRVSILKVCGIATFIISTTRLLDPRCSRPMREGRPAPLAPPLTSRKLT